MTVFKNAKVVFGDRVREACVVTDGERIIDICNRVDSALEFVDCAGDYLAPGFVDAHVHGGGGFSAMSEKPTDILNMARAHLMNGTTSIAPTTLAAPIDKLKSAVSSIKSAAEGEGGEIILGAHLEGPYLSQKYSGAQSKDSILNPRLSPPDELLDMWDRIVMMGAAPECDGCFELGDKLKSRGIVASVAHSAATFSQIEEAAKHGYSDITHIYSACSACHKEGIFRVDGVVEAGLVRDDFTAQAIGDLRHLPIGVLKLIFKCKGADKMYLITDGLEYSASDVKENTVYGQENGVGVIFEDGVMKLSDRSALAGSVATLADCVRNMYKTVGVPLCDAVRMATETPARVLGFNKKIGSVARGYDADLVIFDENINIKSVISKGKKVL